MNDIKERQDKPENLKLLASQRVIYERAKSIFGLQILLTVGFAVLFNFIRLLPKETLTTFLPYILSFSVIVTILDLLLFSVYISKMRTNGAKVQEQFDCTIYQMTWNLYNSGSKADKNFINDTYKKFKADPKKPIENWYDIDLNGLSQEKAILLCQETNLWYDSSLREQFKKAALYFLLGLAAISFFFSLVMHQEVGTMIMVIISPLMPAIALTIKIYQENDKSIKAAKELRMSILSLKNSTDSPSLGDLRNIQDKIFCSRKDGSLVPEWFYIKKRTKLEEGMKINAS